MLTVDEAIELVIQHAGQQPTARVPLSAALGLVLAEPVTSDLDSPPFTKALMDGFAVRSADLAGGSATLRQLGTLMAGQVADRPVGAGTTWQIMTGAPMPEGADAVVIVERSQQNADGTVRLEDPDFRDGQNVMPRGREMRVGETVLEPGHHLGVPEIGLLATVGKTEPLVYRRPTIAVLSTGDEIVPPNQIPGPGQIRNSNAATVVALAQRAGAEIVDLGIARDDHDDLLARVKRGLGSDLLVLSGGVSAGQRDLVPAILAEAGVEKVFQHVSLKPGKPVWFGRHKAGLVFGLPGNPVSVLVCFELFAHTALRARQGRSDPRPLHWPARLMRDFPYPTKRLTYHPARLTVGAEGWEVEPVDWYGSADLRALSACNALLVCPITNQPHVAGGWMSVLPLFRGR